MQVDRLYQISCRQDRLLDMDCREERLAKRQLASARTGRVATMATLSTEKYNLALRNASLVGRDRACANGASGQSKPTTSACVCPSRQLRRSPLAVCLQIDLDPEHQPCDRGLKFEDLWPWSVPLCARPCRSPLRASPRSTPPAICYSHVLNAAETDRVAHNLDMVANECRC